MAFRRDNHYVPCLYLKRFADPSGRIAAYRTLVSHPNVPTWKRNSVAGVAYHAHLYTRIVAGVETDEVEEWLNRDFETPAEEALGKATADMRLTPSDWRVLVRFLAAQDVRTPARLLEYLQRWRKLMPEVLDAALEDATQAWRLAKESGRAIGPPKVACSEYIPVSVTPEIEPGEEFGKLKVTTIVGRDSWLFAVRFLLTETATKLHDHKWTILRAPDDLHWFASDDPVVRLNYYGDGKYDLRGGWGKAGTEIFLPLSPNHLLYTKVGQRPPLRGSVLPRAEAQVIRRFIAEHAHRFIYAPSSDAEVPSLRPRRVDAVAFHNEQEQWRKFHENQIIAEREFRISAKHNG